MDSDRRTVLVSSDSVEGYAEPKMVLEFEGKIYVTLAVLEYDPENSNLDEDKQADLGELQAMLSGARPISGTIYGAPGEVAAMAQSQTRDDN